MAEFGFRLDVLVSSRGVHSLVALFAMLLSEGRPVSDVELTSSFRTRSPRTKSSSTQKSSSSGSKPVKWVCSSLSSFPLAEK